MHILLTMPEWIEQELSQLPVLWPSVTERMALVIRFSRLNFERQTGGPFAAGVFERDSGRLVALGVNRVLPLHCSSAHAEMMALMLAQQKLQTFDLGGPGLPAHQLVVNWRPCAMCFGAIPWSGVRSLVIAGSTAEMERITGFDEGPIHPAWREELQRRGIEVWDGLLKEEAVAVFRDFAASGQVVYNGRLGG